MAVSRIRKTTIAARAVGLVGAASIVLAVAAPVARGYTVLGATFTPDHGSRGAAIVVDGLLLAADCPEVDIWLAPGATPSPPVTSDIDPRLIKITGMTRHPPIGAGGVGDTRPGTAFTFRVPELPVGTYATYSECRVGTKPVPDNFGPGATSFTVDEALPGTDMDSSPMPLDAIRGVAPIVAGLLTAQLLLWAPRRRARVDRRAVD